MHDIAHCPPLWSSYCWSHVVAQRCWSTTGLPLDTVWCCSCMQQAGKLLSSLCNQRAVPQWRQTVTSCFSQEACACLRRSLCVKLEFCGTRELRNRGTGEELLQRHTSFFFPPFFGAMLPDYRYQTIERRVKTAQHVPQGRPGLADWSRSMRARQATWLLKMGQHSQQGNGYPAESTDDCSLSLRSKAVCASERAVPRTTREHRPRAWRRRQARLASDSPALHLSISQCYQYIALAGCGRSAGRSARAGRMADTFSPKSVKDVPKDKFIAAYAAHLKANDKVCQTAQLGRAAHARPVHLPPAHESCSLLARKDEALNSI
jgi:hypothetical protein